MDLRTILEKIGETGMPPQYSSPYQVTEDIRLIVSNCETFNEGDAGDQVCKVARQLQNSWERRWQPDDGTGMWLKWQQMRARHAAENQVRACLGPCQLEMHPITSTCLPFETRASTLQPLGITTLCTHT
jgi:Bromodomain